MNDSSENPVFDIAMAYQRTAALIAAIKLDIFTAIGAEIVSLPDLVSRTGASSRGLRILYHFEVIGLLTKQDLRSSPTHIARTFLDRSAPLAMGKIIDFVAAPEIVDLFLGDPVSYVRRGGSIGLGNVSPDHPVWVRFAKAAVPFARRPPSASQPMSRPSRAAIHCARYCCRPRPF